MHIAYADALAYAAWAGKELPTEAEWEFAAQGGSGTEFAWGDELEPGGAHMANVWQGRFPFENSADDGHTGTSPVGSFPANTYGLLDMIGNVWEWTADPWGDERDPQALLHASGHPRDPAARDQGRLPSVRTELLPALPPLGPATAGDRQRNYPYRLPLRHPDA